MVIMIASQRLRGKLSGTKSDNSTELAAITRMQLVDSISHWLSELEQPNICTNAQGISFQDNFISVTNTIGKK